MSFHTLNNLNFLIEFSAKIVLTSLHSFLWLGTSLTLFFLLSNHLKLILNTLFFTDGVYIWHKDQTLLYQGDIALKELPNIGKLENGTLKVKLISDADFGNYYCQFIVSDAQQPTVNHTVVKLSPPQIISLLAESNRTIVSNLK